MIYSANVNFTHLAEVIFTLEFNRVPEGMPPFQGKRGGAKWGCF